MSITHISNSAQSKELNLSRWISTIDIIQLLKQTTRKHAHKNQKTNEKTQQKNTNENVHSVTTCKKGQQKQQSRFLQEYKSRTSYTPDDGHVGRNM
jgi:Tfp pilus assembly protein PilN